MGPLIYTLIAQPRLF